MKSFLIIAASFVLLISGCRKNKPVNPIDQLPPETQTGANTFGCLVNGEVFKPGGLQLSGGSLSCVYQLIYRNTTDGYVFGISGGKRGSNSEIKDVGFRLDSTQVIEGKTYNLGKQIKGDGYGQYSYYGTIGSGTIYQTNDIFKGSVTFKKFDLANQIASGTFWFNAVNPNGDTVKIRDGRFDVRYTR